MINQSHCDDIMSDLDGHLLAITPQKIGIYFANVLIPNIQIIQYLSNRLCKVLVIHFRIYFIGSFL